jgi:hypothetical protein
MVVYKNMLSAGKGGQKKALSIFYTGKLTEVVLGDSKMRY